MYAMDGSPRLRSSTRWLTALGATALLVAACSSGDQPATPTLAEDADDNRAGYYETVWPSEHADRWRTHAVQGGLPPDVTSADLAAEAFSVSASPMWGYTRDDYAYVIGGSPVSLSIFDRLAGGKPSKTKDQTPYVARLDPATGESRELQLTQGSALNYTGGLLMHENGSIYAVAQSVLYKIDAESFSIKASQPLPSLTSDGKDVRGTAYNGIQVRENGQLILKGFDLTGKTPGGILLLIDPDTLETKARTDSPDVASARLTLSVQDGTEWLYHSTPNDSVRFEVTDSGFTLDDSWTAQFLSPDQKGASQASSPVYLDQSNAVVFANNTLPFKVTTPMQIYSQATNASPPAGQLPSQDAFAESNRQINFFMVAADAFESDIVAVSDQVHGYVAGWQVDEEGGLTRLWSSDEYRSSAGLAIAYDKGHLYVDDRRCDSSGEDCELWLVVLDLKTGEQLAEVQVKGSSPSVAQMFVSADSVYLIASEIGQEQAYVNRVHVP